MPQRMTPEQVKTWTTAVRFSGVAVEGSPLWRLLDELEAAHDGERTALAELERMKSAIQSLAGYIRTRAGHEENCRGWRRPVKDKSAPSRKRRGEWMDLAACTCGPGELLRQAGALP